MIGLLCGALLAVATAAVPFGTFTGTLFPSVVVIHSEDGVIRIDGTGDNAIINYNDKAYVPLRTLSEAMGASVGFVPGASRSDGLHRIDIYRDKPAVVWKLEKVGQNFCSNFPFLLMPMISETGSNETGKFTFYMHNQMKDDIQVTALELTMEVRDKAGKVVFSRALPPFSGVIPSQFGYAAEVTWDHTATDGKPVPQGEYFIHLVRPAAVQYNVLDQAEQKSVKIDRGLGGCNLDYFGITL